MNHTPNLSLFSIIRGDCLDKVTKLWFKACTFDGIDPTSKFVNFSPGNPFAKRYNRLLNSKDLPSDLKRKNR